MSETEFPAKIRRAIAALAILLFISYVAFTLLALRLDGLFHYTAADVRVWISTSKIASRDGFAALYDVQLHDPLQRELVAAHSRKYHEDAFTPHPFAFLPIFAVLWMPLEGMSAPVAAMSWAALQLALLFAAALRLRRHLGVAIPHLALLLTSLPAFFDLLFGNVNVILLLVIVEYFILLSKQSNRRAGAVLSILLLKPQTLLFLLPLLVSKKRWQELWGFAGGCTALVAGSLVLAGPEALKKWASLLLNYDAGMEHHAESMANFRMLGLLVEEAFPSLRGSVVEVIASAGAALTLVLLWKIFRRSDLASLSGLSLALVATLAGTSLANWHWQLPTSLITAVPLILAMAHGRLSPLLAVSWLACPAIVFVFTAATVGLFAAHLSAALTLLILNVAVLLAALQSTGRESQRSSHE